MQPVEVPETTIQAGGRGRAGVPKYRLSIPDKARQWSDQPTVNEQHGARVRISLHAIAAGFRRISDQPGSPPGVRLVPNMVGLSLVRGGNRKQRVGASMKPRERVAAILQGQTVDRLPLMPVVMMFCAERLGVPYRAYVEDYRVLAEAQLLVAEEYDLDVVSIMSDPAREAADCGAAVEFFDDQPPAFMESRALLLDKSRLQSLPVPDPLGGGRMLDAIKSLKVLKERSGENRSLLGWVEGPCAEGADLRGLNTLMLDFYDDPTFVHELFEFVLEMELRYAQAQVAAGADIIGVGDAAASLIGPTLYEEHVWPYEKRLVDGLHDLGAAVRLHICGDTRPILASMGRLGCEIVDLDDFATMSEARAAMGPNQILLGNINPVTVLRNGTPERVRAALAECHRQAGPRYIVGAGCEVPRDTPLENFQALVDYARAHHPHAGSGLAENGIDP